MIPRRKAEDDIEDAEEFLSREAGIDTAVAFVNSVERAIFYISLHPEAGSPSYAERLDIPGLRVWKTKKFPYLIFYVHLGSHVEVWRVLHEKMDISQQMSNLE